MTTLWETEESDLESADEAFEEGFDEADYEAYDEARRSPGRRGPVPPRVPTARGGSAFRARTPAAANNMPVTQTQLRAALARVSQQINVNSTAVKTLDGRVRTVVAEQGRLSAGLRKETADRKRDIQVIRKDLQSTREMIALIGLLFPPGSSGANFAPLAFMLPPDFLGGGGSSSAPSSDGSTSSGGGMLGSNGMVTLVAVAAAAGLFK